MQTISRAEFDKKVEMEYAYLTHVDRMNHEKAQVQAVETVSQSFQVETLS